MDSIIYLAFAASLALCIFNTQAYAEDDWDENPSEIKVDRDTVYMSGATIISLATFGSVLGIRIKATRETFKTRLRGLMGILVGIMAVIWIQGWLMIFACCLELDLSRLVIALLGTCIALTVIIVGVTAVYDPSRDRASDLAKSGSPF